MKSILQALVVLPLIASTAPNCVGVSKRDGAFMEGTTTNTQDLLTACAAAPSYVTHAEPALQSRCVTCHGPGGSGNSQFALIAGTSLTNAQLNSNYIAARAQLLANDGGNIANNLILLNPLGNNGHSQIFTSGGDPDYASVYQWVTDERATPCTAAE